MVFGVIEQMRKIGLFKSENGKAVFSYMNSNLIVAVVVALASVLQAKFVTADELGYFRQFGIITNYLFFLHLGTYQGIERLYPLHIGKGNREKAEIYVSTAEAWIALVSVPVSLVFLCLSVYSFVIGNWKAGLGWLAQTSAMLTTVYGGFIKATYRSGQDFIKMSRAQLIAPLYTIIIIPVYFFWPYVALFLKNIYLLPSTVMMYIQRPIKRRPKFAWGHFKDIVKNGLPRFTSSYAITTGIEAVRSTLVLAFLGQEGLGYWSFTWTIFGLVRQIPQSVFAVYAPKITQEFGRSSNYQNCLKICKKPFFVGLILIIAIIPFGILGALVLIPWLLPNYTEASKIIAVTICFILPGCLMDLPWQVINSMNKPGLMSSLALIDFLIQMIAVFLSFKMGFGIYSLVIGSVCGTVSRGIGLVIFFYRLKRKGT